MAGITNGRFCSKLAPKGFDMVTIGGYNADKKTINAGNMIIRRGRAEFNVPEPEIINHINQQINIIKDQTDWNGIVSVNIRATTPQPIIEISKLKGVDVVEINAHCQQPEIVDLKCGQALLMEPNLLNKFTKEVVKKSASKVSVKIRANTPNTDIITISRIVEDAGADFLHVDAVKPGYKNADYNVISSIKDNTDIFLIGNNSINNIKSALKMITAGADGISMARSLKNGIIPFDLSLV
jgi:TIM-barrel protein